MASSDYASLVILPDIITAPGRYLTRCGETVVVDVVSTNHDFGCRGRYSTGEREGWHKSGRVSFRTEGTNNDIVSVASEE